MIKSILSSALLVLAILGTIPTLLSCGEADKTKPTVNVQGKTMGTFYSIQVPGAFQGGAQMLKQTAEHEFEQITSVISGFDENSEISKVNASTDNTVELSEYLGALMSACRHYSEQLGGAMDITVGPLVRLWGFGADPKGQHAPSQDQIAQASSQVGLDKYEINRAEQGAYSLRRVSAEVQFDLATVGEGLGADAVAAQLDARGVDNYLVSVAGASRSKGVNAKGQPWKIGIEDPTTPEHKVFVAVCPLGKAMSTAGSYRNFFKDPDSDRIYSHIIDPFSGYPVQHQTVSVTVIAPTALQTDALDTGLLVMGADKALSFAEQNDLAVYVIEMVDGKPQARYSSAFKPYLYCSTEQP